MTITATCRRTSSAAISGSPFHLLRPAVFDRYVLALDIARFFQALGKRAARSVIVSGDPPLGNPITGIAALLRARGERPRRRRAAEQRDELAPFHTAPSLSRAIACYHIGW